MVTTVSLNMPLRVCLFACCWWFQLEHMPQEDYPEAIQETLELFLAGETDNWRPGRVVASKMTKKGLI